MLYNCTKRLETNYTNMTTGVSFYPLKSSDEAAIFDFTICLPDYKTSLRDVKSNTTLIIFESSIQICGSFTNVIFTMQVPSTPDTHPKTTFNKVPYTQNFYFKNCYKKLRLKCTSNIAY